MGTLLHFKNIYLAAFENCKPELAVILLKIYSFFCVAMLAMAMYAFAYRAFTGFRF
ncbi:DUF6747 family protein [Costertonia aggregata]|uniref:DUF6747 family protein n=1 Tax=Costertonia aggregata TaxID=343403 RepID=UPI00293C0646|nr:DUF6747 family protein [Costertonia aggregata]